MNKHLAIKLALVACCLLAGWGTASAQVVELNPRLRPEVVQWWYLYNLDTMLRKPWSYGPLDTADPFPAVPWSTLIDIESEEVTPPPFDPQNPTLPVLRIARP